MMALVVVVAAAQLLLLLPFLLLVFSVATPLWLLRVRRSALSCWPAPSWLLGRHRWLQWEQRQALEVVPSLGGPKWRL